MQLLPVRGGDYFNGKRQYAQVVSFRGYFGLGGGLSGNGRRRATVLPRIQEVLMVPKVAALALIVGSGLFVGCRSSKDHASGSAAPAANTDAAVKEVAVS